jgi:Tfp pilus assembly protein PilV
MQQKIVLHRLTNGKGFMLLDVVVCLLLVTILVMPISGLFLQAITSNTFAKHTTVAANLAQTQLELLKTFPTIYWHDLSVPCTIPWQDKSQSPPAFYEFRTEGISVDAGLLVEVKVQVTWQEQGKKRDLTLITYYPTL